MLRRDGLLNFFRKIGAAGKFVKAEALLAKGQTDAAWPLLASLQAAAQDLPVQKQFRVEVDMLSAYAASRLGDWNLSLFHARAAVAGLRHGDSRIPPATRDYLLYYCGGVIAHASWQLSAHPQDSTEPIHVVFAELKVGEVSRDVRLRFPIEGPPLVAPAAA